MSSDRRFEQELPGLLDDLYVGPMPAYRDDLLQQTARTRQRPAWSFLERWLPLVDITRQPVLASRVPWRAIGVGLALLAVLLALVATLVAGSRPSLPTPFGPARNGLVAYAGSDGIFTVDAVTGKSTAIVKGPGDTDPRWSRDGTRLAFKRQVAPGTGLLYVVKADGSDPIQVTPQPLPDIESYTFSPDGKQILISASPAAFTRILIAATDGSGVRQVDLPRPATDRRLAATERLRDPVHVTRATTRAALTAACMRSTRRTAWSEPSWQPRMRRAASEGIRHGRRMAP